MTLAVKHTEYRGTEAAARYVELLTGTAGAVMCFRLIHDFDKARTALNHTSTLASAAASFHERQHDDFGVFAVVNEGGHKAEAITRVRAVFIDGDDIPIPESWHVPPCFIVKRDAAHWHAYWPVADDFPLDAFTSTQKRLAMRYGSDGAVTDLPRVMRVPGFLHLKDPVETCKVTLLDYSGGKVGDAVRRYSLDDVTAGLPELPSEEAAPRAASTGDGAPVTAKMIRDMLACIDPNMKRKDGWLQIAAAIRDAKVVTEGTHEPDESFDGLEVFLEWSRPGDTFNEADAIRVYDDMDPDRAGGATFATLVHLAEQGGYSGPKALSPQPPPPPDEQSLAARQDEEHAMRLNAEADRDLETFRLERRTLESPVPSQDESDIPSGRREKPQPNRWANTAMTFGEARQKVGDTLVLVDMVLLGRGVVGVLAKTGSGKTVLLTTLAGSLTQDRDFLDFPTLKGYSVAYLAGESQESALDHIEAFHVHNGVGINEVRFRFWDQVPKLMSEEDVTNLITEIRRVFPDTSTLVVIIDTWQRATAEADSQSDDADMVKALDQAERISKELGALVVVALHPPKGNSDTASGAGQIENQLVNALNLKKPDESNKDRKARGLKEAISGDQRDLWVQKLRAFGENEHYTIELKLVELPGEPNTHGRKPTGRVAVRLSGQLSPMKIKEGEERAQAESATSGMSEEIAEKEVTEAEETLTQRNERRKVHQRFYASNRIRKAIEDEREAFTNSQAAGIAVRPKVFVVKAFAEELAKAPLRDEVGDFRMDAERSLLLHFSEWFSGAGHEFGDGWRLRIAPGVGANGKPCSVFHLYKDGTATGDQNPNT